MCNSLCAKHHMKVVKSIKMKPPKVARLGLLSFRVVHGRLRRFALEKPSGLCLGLFL
jgi:hypothetical protein